MKEYLVASALALAIGSVCGAIAHADAPRKLSAMQKCLVAHGFGPEANHIPAACEGKEWWSNDPFMSCVVRYTHDPMGRKGVPPQCERYR
jgi:hypothetical protein